MAMKYILLARHGSVDRKAYIADRDHRFSTKGVLQEVERVATMIIAKARWLPRDESIGLEAES